MTVTEDEVAEEYERSLAELSCNSKPQINMLTMLAEENENFAARIVQIIESRITQVPNDKKLPILYLIDSIVKNCPKTSYKVLFQKKLVDIFLHVFERGEEKTRQSMHRLRLTWNEHFPKSKLYNIDIKVNSVDRAWPIANTTLGGAAKSKEGVNIHVNPKFINSNVVQNVGNPGVLNRAVSFEQPSVATKLPQQQKPVSSDPSSGQQVTPTLIYDNSNAPKDPRRKPTSSGFTGAMPQHHERLIIEPNMNVNNNSNNWAMQAVRKVTVKAPDPKPVSSGSAEKTAMTSPSPLKSVVAKVTPPSVKVVVDGAGSWKMESPQQHPPPDIKINKLSPTANRGNYRKTDFQQSSILDKRPSSSSNVVETAGGDNGSKIIPKSGGRGSGASATVGGRGGTSGRGRGAGPSSSVALGKEYLEKPPVNNASTPTKRQRSRSPPSVELSPTKLPKREKVVSMPPKSRRADVVDDELSSTSRKTPTKDVVARQHQLELSPSSYGNKSRPLSFVLPSVDTDMRNTNSTDSDRSNKDVDLRTLPFKKRKRSDDGSTSTENAGYPSDHDIARAVGKKTTLPATASSSVKVTKKRTTAPAGVVKFENISDEMLFGGNEDHDERPKQQRPLSSTTNVTKYQQPRRPLTESVGAEVVTSMSQKEKPRSLPTPVTDREPVVQKQTSTNVDEFKRVDQQQPSVADGKRVNREHQDHDGRQSFSKRGETALRSSFYRKPHDVDKFNAAAQQPSYKMRHDRPLRHDRPFAPTVRNQRPPQSTYNTDASTPDTIPANNKIMVDGQSYDVHYVNDISVIERNGLPHRLYFLGRGREVIIDGVPYRLKFDESRDVLIDGQIHQIRFGGPSRELYMGNFPFRGSFGGPPIFATINGVKHKIQLSGPAPEVKIDPEPSADLMRGTFPAYHRSGGCFSSTAAAATHPTLLPTPQLGGGPLTVPPPRMLPPPPQMFPTAILPPQIGHYPQNPMLPPSQPQPQLPPIVMMPPQPPQPAVNVNKLLDDLIKGNIIALPPKDGATVAHQKPAPTIPSVVLPAVPSRVELITLNDTKMREPAAPLKDFNEKVLKIRYSSVIEALYQERTQCTVCGMRFVERDQKYSKHLDWHFKRNRSEKLPGRSVSRNWYFAAEDWVKFEEFADENAVKTKSVVFEPAQTQADEINKFIVASTDSVILASRDREDLNECAVCNEKFVQFWDEDEEAWKMRNAMMVGEKAYHPLCYQDVSRDLSSPTFGSPIDTDKPMFWACGADTSIVTDSSSTPVVGDRQAPPLSVTPLNRTSSATQIASDRDLMLQSVLSVVCNVPTNSVNSVVNATNSVFIDNDDIVDKKSSFTTTTATPTIMSSLLLPGYNNNNINNNIVAETINAIDNNNLITDKTIKVERDGRTIKAMASSSASSEDDDPAALLLMQTCRSATVKSSGGTSDHGKFDSGSSGGTTPVRDERPDDDSPGTPVHDETSCY